jgi:hypothetical protein
MLREQSFKETSSPNGDEGKTEEPKVKLPTFRSGPSPDEPEKAQTEPRSSSFSTREHAPRQVDPAERTGRLRDFHP